MSDVNLAGEDSLPAPITDVVTLGRDNDSSSVRSLADALVDFRNKRDTEAPAAPEQAAKEEPVKDAAQETGPGEEATKEASPAEETLPPIEPPRSWSKEDKELFTGLPRETQERLAERERSRETDFLRRQNETAEQRKALEAKAAEAEKARQEYEAALPTLIQTLRDAQAGEFSDIKSQSDIDKMATEDWPRFARYQAHLMKIGSLEQSLKQAQERQVSEYKSKWEDFARTEDAKFVELAPEMANKERAQKVADASISILKDIGFSEQDLSKLWNGEASLSLRDHRAQLILLKAAKYDEAIAASKTKVAAKPIPPVQKPGTSQARASDDDVRVKQLNDKLDKSGNWKDAAALIMARRASR